MIYGDNMVVYPVAFSATEEFRLKFIEKVPRRMRSAYIRSAIRMLSEVLNEIDEKGSSVVDKSRMKNIWIDEANIATPDVLK